MEMMVEVQLGEIAFVCRVVHILCSTTLSQQLLLYRVAD